MTTELASLGKRPSFCNVQLEKGIVASSCPNYIFYVSLQSDCRRHWNIKIKKTKMPYL